MVRSPLRILFALELYRPAHGQTAFPIRDHRPDTAESGLLGCPSSTPRGISGAAAATASSFLRAKEGSDQPGSVIGQSIPGPIGLNPPSYFNTP